MHNDLLSYREELAVELKEILDYWIQHTPDEKGGFIGRISSRQDKYSDAPKGSVLNSRILWAFSAAYNLTKKESYLQMANRAFDYFCKNFIDQEYGGVYWTLNSTGEPLDTRKQIYALSFAIYGLSEYYKISGDNTAKKAAIDLYNDVIAYSYDNRYGGYFEAFSRDWKGVSDNRLSEKDSNERKSMNTHLHLLEAFANLYEVWPDQGLKEKLVQLIQIFQERIISNKTNHLNLFFEDDWKPKSSIISYGHDVEASWLLQEATQLLGDQEVLQLIKNSSLKLAMAATRGVDKDGGIWYEYDADTKHLIKQKHSWPQAEAMVGFFNAWQNTSDKIWLQRSIESWKFVKGFIKDNYFGEWHWGVNEDYSTMDDEDKVGIWKCPYHNSRACIEIIQRVNRLCNR